jgi:hypothetical protein
MALRTVTGAKGNYAALRKAVASASQPLVPYLGGVYFIFSYCFYFGYNFNIFVTVYLSMLLFISL